MADDMTGPLEGHFDRAKPFYPLVMNFCVTLHGWGNLMARGVGRLAAPHGKSVLRATQADPKQDIAPLAALRKAAKLPAVMLPFALAGSTYDGPLELDPDAMADELIRAQAYLTPEVMKAGEHLLLLAWETTDTFHTRDPLWEFLRHCRNAAGHRGRFRLLAGEPRRPATFRELEISRSLEGTRLFGHAEPTTPDEHGLMLLGDAIMLLWDIEQAFPALSV